jgi:hypothetical protein
VAAIAWEAQKPLDVTTVIVDPPKKGEVRVKVLAHPTLLRHKSVPANEKTVMMLDGYCAYEMYAFIKDVSSRASNQARGC